MQIKSKKCIYLPEEKYFSFQEKLDNGVQVRSYLLFQSEKFLDYQKDLIQDFLAEFIDACQGARIDLEEIKTNFETGLQSLNTKLKLFADKVRDIEYFPIKGFIQVVVDNILMASMIGDMTIMIFRNKKLYYQLHNGIDKRAKIDLFSDFIEGDLQKHDEMLYAGLKVSDVIDNADIREMETVLESEESSLLAIMEQILTSRVDADYIGFMMYYVIAGNSTLSATDSQERQKWLNSSFVNLKWKKNILGNKYYLTIGVLGLIIFFMVYQVLNQLFNVNNKDVFMTSSGEVVDITIDDIKKDIYLFQSMDPTSDEKGIKYNDILSKLTALETKGRWLEDVNQLKGIIENDYYKGFNIVHVKSLKQFDDPATGIKTQILTLNSIEKTKLGQLKELYFDKDIMIAGSQGALIGGVNDGVRGSLVDYGVEEPLAGCSPSLLRNGIYCVTTNGRIFLATKGGIEEVTTNDTNGFPDTVAKLAVYGKANLYLFQPRSNSSLSGVFVTRYRNTVGSQVIFQPGTNYRVGPGAGSGVSLGSGDFTDFAIDSTFMVRNGGKLYQFRRDPASAYLDIREVKLMGGDKVTSAYSNDVKIITYLNTKYVFLFDRAKQTFTVYDSRPLKTNDQYNTQYNLTYLFRFKFDLGTDRVVDVAIPENSGNRPELYILSSNGVHKINLYEFIDSITTDNVLKTVSTQ